MDTNVDYCQFEGTFLSIHLLSNFNENDPKCDWQAFQAFAYNTTINNFVAKVSETFDKDLISVVVTVECNLYKWTIENDVDGLIAVKLVLGFWFYSCTYRINIDVGTNFYVLHVSTFLLNKYIIIF